MSENTEEFQSREITTDTVIFTIRYNSLQVLLVKRGHEPFKDLWALPGGFVKQHERLSETARRVLYERTSLKDIYLKQLYAFSDPNRFPNARVITVAYFALIRSDDLKLIIDDTLDIQEVKWHSVKKLPSLAFDHLNIIHTALGQLRKDLSHTSLAFQLLPLKFTLTELQRAYEVIFDTILDKRNFRKKMLSMEILVELDVFTKENSKRPARLYSFKDFEKEEEESPRIIRVLNV